MRPHLFIGVLAVVLIACQARADVFYSLVTDQPAYNVAPSGAVLVNVYLEETLTDGSASDLAAQHGLFSFDALVDVVSAPTDPAAVVASAVNTAFNGIVNNTPPMAIIADRDLFASEGVQPVVIDAVTSRILLATVTIQGGAVAGEVTTFTVGDYENPISPGADLNTYYWDDLAAANPLDGAIAPSTFTVTVVPEPTSCLLLAAGAIAVCRRRS